MSFKNQIPQPDCEMDDAYPPKEEVEGAEKEEDEWENIDPNPVKTPKKTIQKHVKIETPPHESPEVKMFNPHEWNLN